MKKIFLFFFALPLFGVELISYNIYDRNDRVDLMLSFDSVYNGNISQKTEKNFTLVTLNDVKYSKEELKNLNSNLVSKVQISSKDNKTYIMFQNKTKANLNISSINDKFGIRIRVANENFSENSNPPATAAATNLLNSNTPEAQTQELKIKNSSLEGYDYTQYILVVLVLVLLLIGLWWFKRTMNSKIFPNSKNFNISFQRPLDKNNQFMIIDYNNKRYVMIVGASNLLLESTEITEEEIQKDKDSFDSVFEENKRKIQNIIQKRQKN